MLNQERAKQLFKYQDGKLIRKTSSCNNYSIGDYAGYDTADGYRQVGVDGNAYLVHRIIWLYHKGYFPEKNLDHIDRNKANDRIENLREVSQQCNIRNTGNRKNNKSGVKGVSWGKRNGKWFACIKIGMKTHSIGLSSCFAEAVALRLAAEQCAGWDSCDSSSPAYRYMQKYIS